MGDGVAKGGNYGLSRAVGSSSKGGRMVNYVPRKSIDLDEAHQLINVSRIEFDI